MDIAETIVARYLSDDPAETRSTKELLRLTGYKHKRELQEQIFRERAAGILIIGGRQGGYHLPSPGRRGRDQMAQFNQTLRARGVKTLKTASFFKKAVRAYDQQHSGQIEMTEVTGDAETESGPTL